jgi:hypothetical protein
MHLHDIREWRRGGRAAKPDNPGAVYVVFPRFSAVVGVQVSHMLLVPMRRLKSGWLPRTIGRQVFDSALIALGRWTSNHVNSSVGLDFKERALDRWEREAATLSASLMCFARARQLLQVPGRSSPLRVAAQCGVRGSTAATLTKFKEDSGQTRSAGLGHAERICWIAVLGFIRRRDMFGRFE